MIQVLHDPIYLRLHHWTILARVFLYILLCHHSYGFGQYTICTIIPMVLACKVMQDLYHQPPARLSLSLVSFISSGIAYVSSWEPSTSTNQLPFKTPQIPSNRDRKALNRGTLGGLGREFTQ